MMFNNTVILKEIKAKCSINIRKGELNKLPFINGNIKKKQVNRFINNLSYAYSAKISYIV